MIQAVDGRLHLEQQLRIAHVLAQIGRHVAPVLEERREDVPVRGDHRVLRVEHVERHRAVVGVDGHLDAVAQVVDAPAVQPVVARVRIRARRGEAVEHPHQPPLVAEDDVRIGVEGEERRDRGDALADVASHQQPALRRDVVAERQPGEIAAVEGDEQPPEQAAERDAARALVRGDAVGVALRVVELLLPRLHVDVGVGELAEVDLRPRDRDVRHRALHRHVAEQQLRQALGREPVDRVHRDAVAVRVDEPLVDPVAAALGQALDVQLADRQHHLPRLAVDRVAVDVDVGKVVVGADLLDLPQRVLQRPPVPEPDVLERVAVLVDLRRFDARLRPETALLDAVEGVRPARHLDVVGDVRALAHQLVRAHDEVRDVPARGRPPRSPGPRGRRRRRASRPRGRATAPPAAIDARQWPAGSRRRGSGHGDVRVHVGRRRRRCGAPRRAGRSVQGRCGRRTASSTTANAAQTPRSSCSGACGRAGLRAAASRHRCAANATATASTITLIVVNQPDTSCQAGSVNR